MKTRQIIRNVDTKQKIYNLIPLKSFLFFVMPVSLPLLLLNLIHIMNNKINIPTIVFSTIIVTVTVFLCSELRFGETGFHLLYDLIFHSKMEHIEGGKKS